MATTFCPLCKSIMKDGICSNRNCGNSIFEIEFNKEIEFVKKYIPEKYQKQFNGAFNIKINMDNPLNYNSDDIKIFNHLRLIENLIKNNIRTFKTVGYVIGTNEPTLEIIRYMTLKESIGKVKSFRKHCFSCSIITSRGNDLNTPVIWGTNDFIKWDDIGFTRSNSSTLNRIAFCGGIIHSTLHNWTLGIKDKKTGIEFINYFSKEKAYALFKDREIKEGKKRRTSLKHIVDDYERNMPKKVLVKEHLRGDMTFEWRGIILKVHPPLIDEIRLNKEEK
jgi:hypothetical protein